jgi:hypothetical protein
MCGPHVHVKVSLTHVACTWVRDAHAAMAVCKRDDMRQGLSEASSRMLITANINTHDSRGQMPRISE